MAVNFLDRMEGLDFSETVSTLMYTTEKESRRMIKKKRVAGGVATSDVIVAPMWAATRTCF